MIFNNTLKNTGVPIAWKWLTIKRIKVQHWPKKIPILIQFQPIVTLIKTF